MGRIVWIGLNTLIYYADLLILISFVMFTPKAILGEFFMFFNEMVKTSQILWVSWNSNMLPFESKFKVQHNTVSW